MKLNKTEIAKKAAFVVVGFGTAHVVKAIIRNNVHPDSVTDKAAVVIGTYVLGAIAADASKEWTDTKIDELIEWWTENISSKMHKS